MQFYVASINSFIGQKVHVVLSQGCVYYEKISLKKIPRQISTWINLKLLYTCFLFSESFESMKYSRIQFSILSL